MAERTEVITLHIRDVVSKTFHITPREVILHTDVDMEARIVPLEYWDEVMRMVEAAEKLADEYTKVVEINVHSEADWDKLGGPAERILNEIASRP